jgi:transcriptional regulator with XRE-family HTH domain
MPETTFSKKLRDLRKKKKWTQDKLGEKIGVHGRSIGKYEVGMAFPSKEVLKKLADIFEVPVEYFLVDEENTLGSVPIKDRGLLQRFVEVDQMDDDSKHVVKTLIDAMIAKKKIQEITK